MSYRPQWAYPLPDPPCEAQVVQYSFDFTNTPALNVTLAAGAQTGRIPLHMDMDADFYLRAIDTEVDSATFPGVSIRLLDPEMNALSDSDNATQATNFANASEYSNTDIGTSLTGVSCGNVALESGQWKLGKNGGGAGGVYAAGGSNFLLYVYNGTAAAIDLKKFVMNLYGVKVYSGECAR